MHSNNRCGSRAPQILVWLFSLGFTAMMPGRRIHDEPLSNPFGDSNAVPDSAPRDPFADSFEFGGVPLQEMPPSGETTLRGSQTSDPDPADSISAAIRNGTLKCAICDESVVAGAEREYMMWHCRDCFCVTHHRCALAWKAKSGIGPRPKGMGANTWLCPNPACKKEMLGKPTSACWCGRLSSAGYEFDPDTPNSCRSPCWRVGRCEHETGTSPCDRICHAGPCNWPCRTDCDGQSEEMILSRLGVCGRFRRRWAKADRGIVIWLVVPAILLVLFFVVVMIYFACYISVTNHPLDYREWIWRHMNRKKKIYVASRVFQLGELLVMCALGMWFMKGIERYGIAVFNIGDLKNKPGLRHLRRLGMVLLLNTFLYISCYLISFVPGAAWNTQMKDSCHGLDSRTQMDNGALYPPAIEFDFTSPKSPLHPLDKYYLGGHLEDSHSHRHGTEDDSPFRYFYRLSGGNSRDGYHAVDVHFPTADLNSIGRWRVVSMNDTDTRNKWLAAGRFGKTMVDSAKSEGRYLWPDIPAFEPVSSEVVMSGTFTTKNMWPHAVIPELDLMIANLWDFTYHEEFEPFLRVFKSVPSDTDKEKRRVMDARWTNKNQKSLVMRTASFGHGKQRLDMCFREGDLGYSKTVPLMEHRISRNLLVPFAIVSAFRRRAYDTDIVFENH